MDPETVAAEDLAAHLSAAIAADFGKHKNHSLVNQGLWVINWHTFHLCYAPAYSLSINTSGYYSRIHLYK